MIGPTESGGGHGRAPSEPGWSPPVFRRDATSLDRMGSGLTRDPFYTEAGGQRRYPKHRCSRCMFVGWLWDLPGAVMAMPWLVILKIVCDHIPGLAAVGELLRR